MDFNELQSLTMILRVLVGSFLVCVLVSIIYFKYLKKRKFLEYLIQFFVSLAILVSIIGIIYFKIRSIQIADFLFSWIISFIPLIIISKFLKIKCKRKEKIFEIDGLPVFICHEKWKIYNAWFNMIKKEINITKSFLISFPKMKEKLFSITKLDIQKVSYGALQR